jgi:hypothetical protein
VNVRPGRTILGGGGGGLSGPIPRDLLLIAAALLVTVTLSSFEGTRLITQLLTITPAVWQRGFLWQLATYPYVEAWGPSLGFVINLILLFLWGRDVYWGLGRRHFWRLLLIASIGAGILATLVDVAGTMAGWKAPQPFYLMQSWTLLSILLAAWARAHRGATILFMFILPIEAGWLIALEILLAFIGFLTTKDLPGFVGICAAIGISWYYIARSGKIGLGKRDLREYRLRMERWWIQRKLDRAKKKRGFRVIPGEGGRGHQGGDVRKGPWVN